VGEVTSGRSMSKSKLAPAHRWTAQAWYVDVFLLLDACLVGISNITFYGIK